MDKKKTSYAWERLLKSSDQGKAYYLDVMRDIASKSSAIGINRTTMGTTTNGSLSPYASYFNGLPSDEVVDAVYENYMIYNGYSTPSLYYKRLKDHFNIECTPEELEAIGLFSDVNSQTIINYNPFWTLVNRSISNAEAMKEQFKVKSISGEAVNERLMELDNFLMGQVQAILTDPSGIQFTAQQAQALQADAQQSIVDRRAKWMTRLLELWSEELNLDGELTKAYLDFWLAGVENMLIVPLKGKVFSAVIPAYSFDYDRRTETDDLKNSAWTYSIIPMSKFQIYNYLSSYFQDAKINDSDIEALNSDFYADYLIPYGTFDSGSRTTKGAVKTEWFFWKAPYKDVASGLYSTRIYGAVRLGDEVVIPIGDYPLQSNSQFGIEPNSFPIKLTSFADRNPNNRAPFDYIKPFWYLYNYLMFLFEKELSKIKGSITMITQKDFPNIGDAKMSMKAGLTLLKERSLLFTSTDATDQINNVKKDLPARQIVLDDFTVAMNIDNLMRSLEEKAYAMWGFMPTSKYDKYISDNVGDMLQQGVNVYVQHPMIKKHSKFRIDVASHLINTLNHIYQNYDVDDYMLSRLDLQSLSVFPNFVKNSKFGLVITEESEPQPDLNETLKQYMKGYENLLGQVQKMVSQSQMMQQRADAAQQKQITQSNSGGVDEQIAYVNAAGSTDKANNDALANQIKMEEIALRQQELEIKREQIKADKYIAVKNKN